jgi:NADH:ubiquinone oxidoreductase subunit 4 (subunit M)
MRQLFIFLLVSTLLVQISTAKRSQVKYFNIIHYYENFLRIILVSGSNFDSKRSNVNFFEKNAFKNSLKIKY